MKRFNLIASINRSGIIGTEEGKIPWECRQARDHFESLTSCIPEYNRGLKRSHGDPVVVTDYRRPGQSGYKMWKGSPQPWKCVIVGRKTWINFEELPHRGVIWLLRGETMHPNETYQADSIDQACEIANEYDEVWVIGGAEVYREFLLADLIQKMVITEIPTKFPSKGIMFPHMRIQSSHKGGVWGFIEIHGYYYLDGDVLFNLKSTTINDGLIVHEFVRVGD